MRWPLPPLVLREVRGGIQEWCVGLCGDMDFIKERWEARVK